MVTNRRDLVKESSQLHHVPLVLFGSSFNLIEKFFDLEFDGVSLRGNQTRWKAEFYGRTHQYRTKLFDVLVMSIKDAIIFSHISIW